MQPLHSVLKGKSQSLTWTEAVTTFHAPKQALANASLIVYPTPDTPTCLMLHIWQLELYETYFGFLMQDDPCSAAHLIVNC